MATIVLYRDGDRLGPAWVEGRASLQYRRCARCGFTVRKVLATTPDPAIVQSVRQAFQSLFGDRSVPRGESREGPSPAP